MTSSSSCASGSWCTHTHTHKVLWSIICHISVVNHTHRSPPFHCIMNVAATCIIFTMPMQGDKSHLIFTRNGDTLSRGLATRLTHTNCTTMSTLCTIRNHHHHMTPDGFHQQSQLRAKGRMTLCNPPAVRGRLLRHRPANPATTAAAAFCLQRRGSTISSARILLVASALFLLSCGGPAATRAQATLLSSSQLSVCVNDGVASIPCHRMIIATLAIDGGAGAAESLVVLSSATSADASLGASVGSTVSLVTPVTIRVTKSVPSILYPVTYVRNFNAAPYEIAVPTALFGCSADSTSSTPTCGRAYYAASGAPVPYSEGYCCDCSLCDLVTLCDSDSRAQISCSLLGNAEAASCLRFSSMWYSGYTIGLAQRSYAITINITVNQSTSSASLTSSSTQLVLSPSVISASQATPVGVSARLVGDFSSFTATWDLTSKMLFVPAGDASDARVAAGAQEWLIVPTTMVSTDGTECNKIGVSYAGFNGQGNRCEMHAGSCTSNQLEDLRNADVAAVAAGRAPTYFAAAYGNASYGSTSSSSNAPFLAFSAASQIAPSVITITMIADSLTLQVDIATADIISITVSGDGVVVSNSQDGVVAVTVKNTGWLASDFTVSVLNCSSGTMPITAQVATIAANHSHTFTFSLFVAWSSLNGTTSSSSSITTRMGCTAAVYNAVNQLAAKSAFSWITTGITATNGSQGGTPSSTSGSLVSGGWSAVSCPSCAWYEPLCFIQQSCFWTLVFELTGCLALLLLLIFLLRHSNQLRKCFCSSDRSEAAATSHAAPQAVVVVGHRRHRRRPHRHRRRPHCREPVDDEWTFHDHPGSNVYSYPATEDFRHHSG